LTLPYGQLLSQHYRWHKSVLNVRCIKWIRNKKWKCNELDIRHMFAANNIKCWACLYQ